MRKLIQLLESGKIKGKRTNALVELLYNKNGYLVTNNLHHINSAYNIRDYGIDILIQRKDYSNDYVIIVN